MMQQYNELDLAVPTGRHIPPRKVCGRVIRLRGLALPLLARVVSQSWSFPTAWLSSAASSVVLVKWVRLPMAENFTHENLAREERAAPGSERSFAIVMAVAFVIVGGINIWHNGRIWLWLITIAGLLILAGYFAPALLKPLNHLWFRFGLLLHAAVNPIVMGFVFYAAVLPTGLLMRALGRDLLRLKIKHAQDTYWIKRQPPGPAPHTMKDQF